MPQKNMKNLLSNLPNPIKSSLLSIKNGMCALPYYGNGRYCPVCSRSSNRFRSFGVVAREDAECAHCNALERHRLLGLFFKENTHLFDGMTKKMLHIAPEPFFESFFKGRFGANYLTADLLNPRAMVQMDICDIQHPDKSFDVIYCSHVLEHVLDDKLAMREFFRVLCDNGWAILNVPIAQEKTYEDSSIVEPKERLKAFGQEDHVRCYGLDYVDRLRESGFIVDIIKAENLVESDEAERMGLTQASGEIYFCTK